MDEFLPNIVPETLVLTTSGTKAVVKENTGRSLFLEYEDGTTEAVPATAGWIKEILPQMQECQWFQDDALFYPARPLCQGLLGGDIPYCLYPYEFKPYEFKEGGQLFGIQIQIGEDIISCVLEEARPLGFWKAEAIAYLNANKELFVLEALPPKISEVKADWKKDDIVRVEGEGLGRILAVFPAEAKATIWLEDKSEASSVLFDQIQKPFHLFEDKEVPPIFEGYQTERRKFETDFEDKEVPPILDEKVNSGMRAGADIGEYYTPLVLIEAVKNFYLRQVCRFSIDLDPASHPLAQEAIGAGQYFTRAEDGLVQQWVAETIFLNPPYEGIDIWIDKAIQEWSDKAFSEAIILVPSKTEMDWYQKLLGNMRGVCFLKKEFLQYRHSDNAEAISFSASLIYFGKSYFNFCEIFTPYGLVLH